MRVDELKEYGIQKDLRLVSKIFAGKFLIPAGLELEQHEHKYDHLSILASGKALVTVGDLHYEFEGPTEINVRAHKKHRVKAITDIVWYCIHNTDVADVDDVEDTLKV